MKSSGSESKDARLSRLNYVLQSAAIVAISGSFVAASLILGGQAPRPVGAQGIKAQPIAVSNPDGSERYLTHITTDKPIYRTGEKLYVRGVILRANGHTAMASNSSASFEIKGPKGDTVASGFSPVVDSTVAFSWDIPASQAGGEYTVRILHPQSGNGERKFDIRAYRAPRLKTQVVFVRDG